MVKIICITKINFKNYRYIVLVIGLKLFNGIEPFSQKPLYKDKLLAISLTMGLYIILGKLSLRINIQKYKHINPLH